MLVKKQRDWKNEKDYRSLKNITLDQWAWEFLRRNPEYIEDWKEVSKDLTEEEKQLPSIFFLYSEIASFDKKLRDARKWGIAGPYLNPDFAYNYIKFIPFNEPNGPIDRCYTLRSGSQVIDSGFNRGYVTHTFNFLAPIVPQIKVIKELLLSLQKEAKEKGLKTRKAFKPHRDEWVLLIRILDAEAKGVKDMEIARVIFPNHSTTDDPYGIKKVYDKRMQAKRYVNQDYRYIPFSDQ